MVPSLAAIGPSTWWSPPDGILSTTRSILPSGEMRNRRPPSIEPPSETQNAPRANATPSHGPLFSPVATVVEVAVGLDAQQARLREDFAVRVARLDDVHAILIVPGHARRKNQPGGDGLDRVARFDGDVSGVDRAIGIGFDAAAAGARQHAITTDGTPQQRRHQRPSSHAHPDEVTSVLGSHGSRSSGHRSDTGMP